MPRRRRKKRHVCGKNRLHGPSERGSGNELNDGSDVRVGIITARWHDEINGNLIAGAKESLKKAGVKEENIVEREVPGSFELPLACRFLGLTQLR